MADTTRSLAALQALLADNAAGDISAQDARDFLVSAYKPQALVPGGRLTTESGVPVSTSDRLDQTTIYYTPYSHNCVGLYDGTSWTLHVFTERSLALSSLTSGKNYDVFLYDNSGTLTLELSAAWTNDTTRADALTTQDGVYVKNGATSRRYLGTIRTTDTDKTADAGGGTTTQVGGKRYVWNADNRVVRHLAVIDKTNSWTYTTETWRQAGAAAGNKVEFVQGLAGERVMVHVGAVAGNAGGNAFGVGVGLDSTSANSAHGLWNGAIDAAVMNGPVTAAYTGTPGIGYHYLAWLEISQAAGTTTWFGDNGLAMWQSGMVAEVMA